MPALQDKTVLIIGRDSGIVRAVALAVSQDGGRVVAGLHPDELAEANRGPDIGIEHVDVTDEPSIAALAALTSGFLTGVSIPVDGGEHLVQAKGSVRYGRHSLPRPGSHDRHGRGG